MGHSTPQTKPRFFHASDAGSAVLSLLSITCWSSQVTTCSQRSTHLSQLRQTNGPPSRSDRRSSMPSCSSRIRLAICLEVSGTRKSSKVRVCALKYSSNRPLLNVPSIRGPMRFRARRRRICSSASRSMRCSTCGPYIRRRSFLLHLEGNRKFDHRGSTYGGGFFGAA